MGAPRTSERSKRIAPFEVMDIVASARRRDLSAAATGGDPVLHLEVGQPSARPPAAVLDAARSALDGPLGYTDALGTTELRDAVAGHYASREGIEVETDRVAVTSGASAGCVLTLLSLCDPGERVLLFEPGYPCYRNIAESLGLEVQAVSLGRETGYVPTVEHCEAALGSGGPVAVVLIASPSNPTGSALSEHQLAELHRWCIANGATLVVDEIYHGTGTGPLASAAPFDDAVVIQSFSKYFCMTGWRLGWLIVPEGLLRSIETLQQNLYLAPHTLSQAAAVAALRSTAELDAHGVTYLANRRELTSALTAAGVEDIAPAGGAFYVWADLSRWGPSHELCRTWLEDIALAATPGTDFDSARGTDFVRFSVAGSSDEVRQAADRLRSWLGSADAGVAS